jgi:hypothetical protein
VHRCAVELEEAAVGQSGARDGGTQWTGVRRSASA